MTRVYTRLGDDGTTGLLFGGRVSKADGLIATVGAIDEAVATLGIARAAGPPGELSDLVLELQRELFVVAADLACNPRQRRRLRARLTQVSPEMVTGLEARIDGLVARHPLRPVFVVSGANLHAALLDLARATARRAERHAISLVESGRMVAPQVVAYLNRLSDLLYVMARAATGTEDEPASHE